MKDSSKKSTSTKNSKINTDLNGRSSNGRSNGKQSTGKKSKSTATDKTSTKRKKQKNWTDLKDHDLEKHIYDHIFDKEFFRLENDIERSRYNDFSQEEQKKALWAIYLEDQDTLSPTSLFDVDYYLEQTKALPEGTNPFLHFMEEGWKTGKNPHWLFDCDYYLDTHQDIKEAKMNPFSHFLEFGWKEKRTTHPLFNQNYYEGLYQDLKGTNLLLHYVRYGYKERRNPSLFFNNDYFRKLYEIESDESPIKEYLANPDKYPKTSYLFNGNFYKNEAAKIQKKKEKEFVIELKELAEVFESGKNDLRKTYEGTKADLDKNDVQGRENLEIWYKNETEKIEKHYNHAKKQYEFVEEDIPLIHFIANIDKLFEASPSKYFNSVKYAEKYKLPEDGSHPLVDYLAHPNRKIFNVISPSIEDQLIQAAKLDSKLIGTNGELSDLGAYELPNKPSELLSLTKKVFEILDEDRIGGAYKYEYIFTLSTLRRGGAELVVMKFLNAILKYSDHRILLIYTDKASIEAADWLRENDNLTVLDFHKLQPYASFDERGQLLSHLIEIVRPKRVINTNSWVSWETYKQFGKSLSQITSIEACLFCYDYDANGKKCGYPTDYFRDTEPYLNRVYTENKAFIKEMTQDFGLYGDKVDKWTLIYQPHKPYAARMEAAPIVERIKNDFYGLPKVFLWASRIHRQKCPDVLIEIAKKCPDIVIEVWAPGNLLHFTDDKELPENIIQKGEFKEFFDLPLHNKAGFLYTSAWDGIPTIIIDSISAGLPVIAPNVGGISELVDHTTGWLIEDHQDVEAYAKAIEEATTDYEIVRAKLVNAKARLEEQHGYQNYIQTLKDNNLI